ncbi:MAG: hypothetical protein ACOY71_08710 [Gemmatimonadota bacterium]
MLRGIARRAVPVLVIVAAGCAGAGPVAGTWTKSMAGEGDVKLIVDRGGKAKVELPSPRWPAEVDMEMKMTVKGDSLHLGSDSGPSACGQPAPAYTFTVQGDQLTIGGGNTDPCGVRHAALVGTWKKG